MDKLPVHPMNYKWILSWWWFNASLFISYIPWEFYIS